MFRVGCKSLRSAIVIRQGVFPGAAQFLGGKFFVIVYGCRRFHIKPAQGRLACVWAFAPDRGVSGCARLDPEPLPARAYPAVLRLAASSVALADRVFLRLTKKPLAPNRLCAMWEPRGWPGQRRPEGRRAPEASRGPPGHGELRSPLPRPPIPLVGAHALLGARKKPGIARLGRGLLCRLAMMTRGPSGAWNPKRSDV